MSALLDRSNHGYHVNTLKLGNNVLTFVLSVEQTSSKYLGLKRLLFFLESFCWHLFFILIVTDFFYQDRMRTGLVKASMTKTLLAFYSLSTTTGSLPDGELLVVVGVGWTIQCICTEILNWGILLSQYVNLEHFLADVYVSKELDPF